MKRVSNLILASVLGGAFVLSGQYFFNSKSNQTIKFETPAPISNSSQPNIPIQNVNWMSNLGLSNQTIDFRKAASNSLNSVVHVNTQIIQTRIQSNPLMEFFYGPGARREQQFKGQSSGSGVIISSDGFIVTNNHVIDNASEIEIVMDDRTSYKAEVIGVDPSTDLALLKIDAQGLRPIALGNSDEVEVGSWVLAVGNPFNLTSTVTAGIVSAKSRNINILRHNNTNNQIIPIESFIQTDAAVNPGNSGGALVNMDGELIGINTAIASNTGSYTGYAFAIPANLVKKVTKDLMEYGTVQRGYLGVHIQDISQEIMEIEKLESTQGVFVAGIIEDGSAEKAGIKKGDIILKVEGENVKNVAELQELVGRKSPGDKIELTIKRGFLEQEKSVILKNIDGKTDIITKEEVEKQAALGAVFENTDPTTLKTLGLKNGVTVSKLYSGKLLAAGIPKGFIITKINNLPVKTADEVTALLKKANGGILVEGKNPDGSNGYYGFGM